MHNASCVRTMDLRGCDAVLFYIAPPAPAGLLQARPSTRLFYKKKYRPGVTFCFLLYIKDGGLINYCCSFC